MTIAPQHPSSTRERTTPWRVEPGHRHRHPHQPPASAGTADDRPKLADGIELLGAYEGSGYKEPHHLARRANGSVIQLTNLLYLVASASDGRRTLEEIATATSEEFGRTVSTDNVRVLVDDKLRPLGVLAGRDGTSPDIPEADPLLALKFRVTLLRPPQVRVLGRIFAPLFFAPFIIATVLALLTFDGWLFGVHGLAQGLRQTLNDPALFLLAFGVVVVSAAFHEIGHASACVRSGGQPGRMGAGLYLAWPAFYTDVTDAYRLPKGGRLRTDLGGIYFNALSLLALVGIYFGTHFEPLLLFAFLLQIEVLHQLLPFLRLDGYYVVSDLVGVPDLFRRVGPILRSAVPGREADPSVDELKPWVRRVVTGWVLVVVPVLLANLALIIASMPRIVGTAWDSGASLWGSLGAQSGVGKAVIVLELLFLAVPVLGVIITFARVGGRSGRAAWTWSAGSPPRRSAVLGAGLGLVALLSFLWWPSRDYTPYRPGETGTLQQQVSNVVANARQGTPLFRSPKQAQLPLPPAPGVAEVSATPTPTASETTAPTGTTTTTTTTSPSPAATPIPTATASPSLSPSPTATTTP
jgi:putative peptide zinc metalloprotease protein